MKFHTINGINGTSATIDLNAFVYAVFSPTVANRPSGHGRLAVAVQRATGVIEEASLMLERGLELASLAATLRAAGQGVARLGQTIVSIGEIAAIESRELADGNGWHHKVILHVDRYDSLIMRNAKVMLPVMDERPLHEILPMVETHGAAPEHIEAQLALL